MIRMGFAVFLLIQMACANISYNNLESSLKPTRERQAHQVSVFIHPAKQPDVEKVLASRIQQKAGDFVLVQDPAKADYILTADYTENAGWYFNEKTGHCSRESGNVDVFVKLLWPWASTACDQKLELKVQNQRCRTYDKVWAVNVQFSYITLWLIPAFPVNWLIHTLNPPDRSADLNQLIDEVLARVLANQGHYDHCERSAEVGYRERIWFPSPDRFLPHCQPSLDFRTVQFRYKAINDQVGYMEKVSGGNFPCRENPGDGGTNLPTCAQACPDKTTLSQDKYPSPECNDVPGFRCLIHGFGADPDRP